MFYDYKYLKVGIAISTYKYVRAKKKWSIMTTFNNFFEKINYSITSSILLSDTEVILQS